MVECFMLEALQDADVARLQATVSAGLRADIFNVLSSGIRLLHAISSPPDSS